MISFIDIVLSIEAILLFLLGGVLFICTCCTGAWDIQNALDQPEQEPVAWIDEGSLKSLQESTGYALRFLTNDTENLKNTDVPLYLAPPKRKPLSEDQVDELLMGGFSTHLMDLVRIIEKAHGIGVDDE